MVLFSDMFGTICLINIFSLLIFTRISFSICKIDRYERKSKLNRKIYPGKWSFLFFTHAKEKDWYPKKTIVLELLMYIVFMTTIIFSICSIFIKVDYALEITLLWCTVVFSFIGYISASSRYL